jgi:hypothetical protein
MFYLGIDQHARQLTISLRDEGGDVVQARQVSTQPQKVHAFFQQLTRERLTAASRSSPCSKSVDLTIGSFACSSTTAATR